MGKTKNTILGAGIGYAALGPVGGLIGAKLVRSQSHWKADTWNQNFQNTFGARVGGIVDPLGEKRKAGTLTYDDVLAGQKSLEGEINDFYDAQGVFESLGGDQATVIKQSRRTMDPIIAQWKKTFEDDVTRLKPPNPEDGVDPLKPPTAESILEPLGQTKVGQAIGAADQRKKRAESAQGRKSTILAGGGNYKESSKKTTLLGGGTL